MSAVKLLWQPVRCRISKKTVNRWRMVVSGTWKYDDPRLYVTQGRSPSVTCSTEGRPISMSHERLCVICFVVWPTRFAYKMAAFLRVLPTRRRQQTKRKQKQRRIYLTFTRVDIIMSTRVTVKRWTYDNAQSHVTAFRPISEAAHSWSYNNKHRQPARSADIHGSFCVTLDMCWVIKQCDSENL